MAAGAIPPPLFFERRRDEGSLLQRMALSGTPEKHNSVDLAFEWWVRLSPTMSRSVTAKDS